MKALKAGRYSVSAKFPGIFFLAFSMFMFLLTGTANAQGDLLLFPKRLVFENTTRSQVINLTNIGKDTARYNVSFVQIRMKEDGSVENISTPDSGQYFADKNLRFFPRSVTLAPNESQTVKVQLVNAGALQPGEYRSHLYFRAVPTSKPLGENNAKADSGSISIRLTPVFGISMATIIRIGENDAKVNISNASLKQSNDTTAVLSLKFNRTGKMSVYGDISVDHIGGDGRKTRVGVVKGMAVYSPNQTRTFNLRLDKKAGVNYRSGKLHIVYTDQSAKSVKLAETQIALN
jgi:P pilus assembly chaperone PapD